MPTPSHLRGDQQPFERRAGLRVTFLHKLEADQGKIAKAGQGLRRLSLVPLEMLLVACAPTKSLTCLPPRIQQAGAACLHLPYRMRHKLVSLESKGLEYFISAFPLV